MVNDCPECQRLWAEYQQTSADFSRREKELQNYQLGVKDQDEMTAKLAVAKRREAAAKRALKDHELSAHSTKV